MPDTTPTRRRHDTDATPDRDVLTPTDAARRLGITPDAVRARLRRGTLAGERISGDWRVFLPPDATATVDRHDADTTPSAAVIAAKDETIAILRQELTARTDELRAAHVIISQLTQRLPQISAGGDARPHPTGSGPNAPHRANGGSTERPRTNRRRWWQVWRR